MLTTLPFNSEFDLASGVGQRSATFVFKRINGVTGQNLGEIHPIRNATLSHDTSRTIKRQLTLNLGAADTAAISPLTDRILLYMKDSTGTLWPLGKYMFTDDTGRPTTNGELSNVVLNDEMFLIDQQIVAGIDTTNLNIAQGVLKVMNELPSISVNVDPSPFASAQAWAAGTARGGMLETLAKNGDYFSAWLNNAGLFRMIRSFDPALAVPQFDYDAGHQVIRNTITTTSNLLTAPNRFLVISNTGVLDQPISAVATVPPTAPHSFANRGFYITTTQTLQLTNLSQAQAVANNLANRLTVFETVNLSTGPDPRHDSYDVINWQGNLWLELAWGMNLTAGGAMTHVMRKAYMP